MKFKQLNQAAAQNQEMGGSTVNRDVLNYTNVLSVDHSVELGINLIDRKVAKNGNYYYRAGIIHPAFSLMPTIFMFDNGIQKYEESLRFRMMNLTVKDVHGNERVGVEFKPEFSKYIDGALHGKYKNAFISEAERNSIYRDGLSLETNDLVKSIVFRPSKFFSTKKKAGWNILGEVDVELSFCKINGLRILDLVDTTITSLLLCDNAIDGAAEKKQYAFSLSQTVKASILGQLIARGDIMLNPNKTGENFVNHVLRDYVILEGNPEDYSDDNSYNKEPEVDNGPVDYSEMKVAKLKEMLKERKISFKSGANKAELIELLVKDDNKDKQENVNDNKGNKEIPNDDVNLGGADDLDDDEE